MAAEPQVGGSDVNPGAGGDAGAQSPADIDVNATPVASANVPGSGRRRVVAHRSADHRVPKRAPSYAGGGGRFSSTRLAAEGGSDGGEAWRAAALQASGPPPPEVEVGNTPMRDGSAAFEEAAETLKPFTSEERVATFEKVLEQRTSTARFVIEDPINPSNAWACLRSLDSFGVQYVDVITNPDNYIGKDADGKYKRMNVAMGTQKWLEMGSHTSSTDCIMGLKEQGYTILATDLSPGAVAMEEVDWANIGPFAIVLGNEEQVGLGYVPPHGAAPTPTVHRPYTTPTLYRPYADLAPTLRRPYTVPTLTLHRQLPLPLPQGISQEMRELADTKFYVPMKGFAQSFSLSVGW